MKGDIIILCVNHFDDIFNNNADINSNKQQSIIQLFNLLKTVNNTVKYIAVNFGKDIYTIPNLQFINLPVNLQTTFTESKTEFTQQLYQFTQSIF